MPRRYYRRYYRRRKYEDPFEGVIVLAALVVIALYYRMSGTQKILATVLAGSVIFVAVSITLYFVYRRHRARMNRLRALSLSNIDHMSGLEFEKYVAELLKAQGFNDITLTEKYDLGVDILAAKDGMQWGIQVKRYSDMVKAEAIRQVVTALNHYNCQRAMVITNSVFSRPAVTLASSNECMLVDRDTLADWIFEFQRGTSVKQADVAV